MKTLVLHGFAGSAGRLLRFFPGAEAPVLPGHANAPDATAWNDALDQLSRLLDPGQPATVFGYSMGARLALGLALRRPDAIASLVLESGTAGIADPGARAHRKGEDDALADFLERSGME